MRSAVGRAVVPLLNELISSDGELRRRLADHQEEITRLNNALWEHDTATPSSPTAGSLAVLDALPEPAFAQHIAALCRRDGCPDIAVTPARHTLTGRTADGRTADGRPLTVQCTQRAPDVSVTSADVEAFARRARNGHGPRTEAALLVSNAPFTRDALLDASRRTVTAVHRGLLESWNNGARLRALAPLR